MDNFRGNNERELQRDTAIWLGALGLHSPKDKRFSVQSGNAKSVPGCMGIWKESGPSEGFETMPIWLTALQHADRMGGGEVGRRYLAGYITMHTETLYTELLE